MVFFGGCFYRDVIIVRSFFAFVTYVYWVKFFLDCTSTYTSFLLVSCKSLYWQRDDFVILGRILHFLCQYRGWGMCNRVLLVSNREKLCLKQCLLCVNLWWRSVVNFSLFTFFASSNFKTICSPGIDSSKFIKNFLDTSLFSLDWDIIFSWSRCFFLPWWYLWSAMANITVGRRSFVVDIIK